MIFTITKILVLALLMNQQAEIPASGYKIRVKVSGITDSACYLGHYYGQYQYVDDTAKAGPAGEFIFEGTKDLPGGIYFVVLPRKKFFEFIIDKEQQFSIETDTADLIRNTKFKGSNDNKVFYDYLVYAGERQKAYEAARKLYERYKDSNKDSADMARKQMEVIDKEVKDYKTRFMQDNPGNFMAKVFLASKDNEPPEVPVLPNGRKDSVFSYRYFRAHYWDNIDFNDDRILRTPVLYNRINNFFTNVIPQVPDSIIAEADKLVERARVNKEMFKYVVWWLTYTYETSQVMGFDAIFVYMVEKYYMTDQAFWISAKVLENLTKRAMKLKPVLIGKVAPNMIMQDTSLQLISMHNLKTKYTVLLFWDWSCGHCKTEMSKVKEFYDRCKTELDAEIFGVCTDTNMMEMKKFIREHAMNWINVNGPRTLTGNCSEQYDIYSTPVIYLLDNKKVIIAKRISIEQAEEFIRRHMKMKPEDKL